MTRILAVILLAATIVYANAAATPNELVAAFQKYARPFEIVSDAGKHYTIVPVGIEARPNERGYFNVVVRVD